MEELPAEYQGAIDPRGRLRPERVDDILFEISSGKHVFECRGELYASQPPSLTEQQDARLIYIRRLREARNDNFLLKEDMERLAIRNGIFTQAEREEKANLQHHMESLARSREMTRDHTQRVAFDSQLLNLRSRILEILQEEDQIFRHSAENFAENWRQSYLVALCTCTGETLDDQFWSKWDEFLVCVDHELVQLATHAYIRVTQGLPIKIIRALARNPQWRQIWKSSTESNSPLFDGPGIGWDTNKRQLIWWSDFYDSVFQHSESPPEETINDDESLQGWMNQMLERQQQAKTKLGGQTVYTRDGKGNRKAMVQVGGHNINVNQGYRVPGGVPKHAR